MTSSDDLRRAAARLFEESSSHRSNFDLLCPGDELIGAIPVGRASELALVRRPVRNRAIGANYNLQLWRLGPGGRRVPLTRPLLIASDVIPLLAEIVAEAVDVERRELAAAETMRRSRGPAPPAGGNGAPAGTSVPSDTPEPSFDAGTRE